MATVDLWAHQDELAALARRQPFGLITDFDGVLSEIAPSPAQARISPACHRHLAALAQRLPLVAVVSGRPVQEVVRLVGLEDVAYYGNHGLERWAHGRAALRPEATSYREQIIALVRELGPSLPAGVIIEDKGLAVALHYRQAADPPTARQAILSALEHTDAAHGLQVSEGKMVVEVKAPAAAHKGTALLSLAADYGLRAAVYIGDDLTDLDAFAALRELARRVDFRGIALAVTGPETPISVLEAADFTLEGVADVARFLAWLAEALAA
ncbi:MAG: trehalose-phosphatase [Dehalococcoidia bacterium]